MLKPLTMWIITNCGKPLKRWEYQIILPVPWETCMLVKKQHLEPSMGQLGRRQWYPTPVLLPRKSHGWRSLVGCNGVTKSQTLLSDFTFTFHFHALEKEMATHSSVLAWRIPWVEKPGRLQSMGSHRVGHDWSDLAAWDNWLIQCWYRDTRRLFIVTLFI